MHQNNRKGFRFEKLEVWQEARILTADTYSISGAFPSEAQPQTNHLKGSPNHGILGIHGKREER
jgi:hypothetical protein